MMVEDAEYVVLMTLQPRAQALKLQRVSARSQVRTVLLLGTVRKQCDVRTLKEYI